MQYLDDLVIIQTNDDLNHLLEKYNCTTLEALEELLWYNYGITVKDNRKPINAI